VAAAGHQVHLVCPWNVQEGEGEPGITFHPFPRVPSRIARPFLVPARVMPRVFGLLRDVDIVHFHDIDLLPWMTLVALSRPVVYDVHENYPDEMLVREWIPRWARRPLSVAVRWTQWLCTQIIRNVVLVAPSQEADFESPRLRRTYIYNFASRALADLVRRDYATREETVVFVGSQHENNGSMLLLDIAETVAAVQPGIRFLAVDRFFDGEFRNRFCSELSRRRLENVVRLVPNVKPHELMTILNQGTIGISPNLRVPQQIKGIHTKVFEYMAAGLPMVLSDLPHQVEVIRCSGAGLLAAPEQPASFAAAILELAADRAKAREMGDCGQAEFLARYCYESQSEKVLSFYRRILGLTT
jgi:glycosyltransferase involved in cell wall biosynthesis